MDANVGPGSTLGDLLAWESRFWEFPADSAPVMVPLLGLCAENCVL